MSGNPFGLSEISHYGSFQRVGGKAGGFINKKFFHPSSMNNQEKLWKAQSAAETEARKQNILEKRREEERSVEEMRKQLYLAGQGKASDLFVRGNVEDAKEAADKDQKEAIREEKRRRAQVKAAAQDNSDDEASPVAAAGERLLVRSRYKEDKFESGHCAVWGSWYSKEDSRWGFGCCKALERKAVCPLAPEETPASEAAAEQKEKARGNKRKRKGGDEEDEDDKEASSSSKAAREEGGLQSAAGQAARAAKAAADEKPLMDMRMLEASDRRKQKKREEEAIKEAAKKSDYLTNLLNNPAEIEKDKAEPPA